MNHERTQAVLLAVERTLPVNAYWVDDVQVWPLVRRALWMHLLSLPDVEDVPVADATGPGDTPDRPGARRISAEDASQLARNRAELAATLGPADVLVWSRPEDHTETFAEGVLDRIADPLLRDARALGLRAIKVSRAFPADTLEQPMERPVELRLDVFDRSRVRHLPVGSAEALLAALRSLVPGFDLTHSQLVSEVRRLNYCADVFGLVLEIVRPRMVFLGVYYSPEALALIHACRKAGVVVLDVQHGKQGLHHGMYGGWSVAPREGYSCLPDFFWTWGESSAATINDSLVPEGLRPRAMVGGNRWLARWQAKIDTLTPTPELAALLTRIDGAGRAILVSLQPLAEPLPAVLLELMAIAPGDWLWVLKAHPQRRGAIPALTARLEALGLSNFEIEVASRAPLYPLLERVHAHVTCWSSVAFEALNFAKPSLLLDPTALKLYGDYLEAGYFTYADNAADALAFLQQPPEIAMRVPSPPYIETSADAALGALGRIARERVRNGPGQRLGWLGIWWKIQRARVAHRRR